MTLLVLDIGSSSVRALICDEAAQPITDAVVSIPHRFLTDSTGMSVADAGMLQDMVEDCIEAVLMHPAAKWIHAVGMATFVGNLVGIGDDGKAITPIYTYADTRSHADVQLLSDQLDLTAAHQRTGCLHHTAYHPARLHWLKRTQPELYAQVCEWVDFGTYLYRQWFGIAPCSYSVASWSGLLNRETLTWDDEWLNVLGLTPRQLPYLADYTATLAGLRPKYANRWEQLRGLPFFLAVGDGAAANLGGGGINEASIALTVGTTAALRRVITTSDRVPNGLWSYRVDAHRHLVGGATSEGGNIYQWLAQTMKLPEDIETQLAQRVAAGEIDAHGLTFLPLLAGERSPGWRSHAVGTIHGLRLSTTPLDMLQAALEGIANRLALIANQLTSQPLPVYAGGGALRNSPAWAQLITNALNRPVYLLQEDEVTARGVALLLLEATSGSGLGGYPPVVAQVLHPQSHSVERLLAARERQQSLYQTLYP